MVPPRHWWSSPKPGTGPVAFAASFPYSTRPCYAGVDEFSVYVARDYRGSGAGRAVLAALIEAATAARSAQAHQPRLSGEPGQPRASDRARLR